MRRKLLRLTFAGGYMRKCVKKDRGVHTFVALEEYKVLGWAIVFVSTRGNHAQIFVHKKHRKLGIARKLIERTLSVYPNILLSWHDDVTEKFFKKLAGVYLGRIEPVDYWQKKNLREFNKMVMRAA